MDLHIHSCLSPCGDRAMTPAAIVAMARMAGLDAIGITDHNSAGNAIAVRSAGEAIGLPVLTGMEVCTREEVHILVFFDRTEDLMAMQELVYGNLAGQNDPLYYGEQLITDAEGETLGTEPRLLIGATDLSLEDIATFTRGRGGVVIASHIDRPSYSLISQLGFLPENLTIDAVELSVLHGSDHDADEWLGKLGTTDLPWVRFSDAHYIQDIGTAATVFEMETASTPELRFALAGLSTRRIIRE